MESSVSKKTRIELLKMPVDILHPDDLEETIKSMIQDNEVHQIVLLSLKDLITARRNEELKACIKQASLVLPISPGIIKGAKFLNKGIPLRYMPFDFVIRLLGILEQMGKSVYLLGSRPAWLQISESNLRTSFPGLKIVGRCSGYFQKAMKKDIVLAIKKAAPTLLLAGKGLIGQNLWIYEHKKQFSPGIFLWCGDCYEIFSGRKKRISRELWNKGLDFIPEFFKAPWRIFRLLLYLYYHLLLLVYKIQKL
ncbi:MAG: WecB/TagA/CpsF family glycosyltransferase [Spirochaetota bacterium]